MPAYLTHRAAGERVLKRLESGAIPNKRAFYLGCQGPDILYFNKDFLSGGLWLGIIMHNQKTRELIWHVLNFIKTYDKPDREELISYLAGFFTHYTIDKNSHPFIYDKSGVNIGMHHAIEYVWDYYTSKEEWDMEPQYLDIYSDFDNREIGESISAWYVSAARNVYGKTLKDNDINRSWQLFFKSKKRMYTSPPLACRVFLRLTSGLKAMEWIQFGCGKETMLSCTEYVEMKHTISKGIDEACELIGFMLQYIDGAAMQLPDQIIDNNFLGDELPIFQNNEQCCEDTEFLDSMTRS